VCNAPAFIDSANACVTCPTGSDVGVKDINNTIVTLSQTKKLNPVETGYLCQNDTSVNKLNDTGRTKNYYWPIGYDACVAAYSAAACIIQTGGTCPTGFADYLGPFPSQKVTKGQTTCIYPGMQVTKCHTTAYKINGTCVILCTPGIIPVNYKSLFSGGYCISVSGINITGYQTPCIASAATCATPPSPLPAP
jgi:hypothetical protein